MESEFKFCYNCGAKIPKISSFCFVCGAKQVFTVKYAGFWIRFFAYLIDNIIVFLPGTILFIIIGLIGEYYYYYDYFYGDYWFLGWLYFLGIATFVFRTFYFTILESSKRQATFGKRLFKLIVVDTSGNRITYKRAGIRYLSRFISFLTIFGYLMAGFTPKKQASHDFIANTIVVKRS